MKIRETRFLTAFKNTQMNRADSFLHSVVIEQLSDKRVIIIGQYIITARSSVEALLVKNVEAFQLNTQNFEISAK